MHQALDLGTFSKPDPRPIHCNSAGKLARTYIYVMIIKPSVLIRIALNVCAKRGMLKMRIGRCFGRLDNLAGNSYQQVCAWSWENRSPCLMPWIDCACCARNICNRLEGREVMLAQFGCKQARDQKSESRRGLDYIHVV